MDSSEPIQKGSDPLPPGEVLPAATCSVCVARMTHATQNFHKGQKVWLKRIDGPSEVFVTGKHRGKGRYVNDWIKWNKSTKPEPEWTTVEVSIEFAERHSLQRQNPEL